MVNEKMVALGNQSSIIRELFEYGKLRKLEIGEDKVFDFSIGNPSVPCPTQINEKLIELIKNNDPISLHGYSSAIGHVATRNEVANYLNKTYNANALAKHIIITAGAAPGLAMTFAGLLHENEEVIVIAPFWPEYKVFIENGKGKMVIAQSNDKFLPDIAELERKINSKTKCVVINNPNNPTGVVYDEKVIIEIAKLLNKKQEEYGHEIYLVSDEPYRELVYNNVEYPFVTRYYDNSIVIYSFSKSISLPGERIGYVLVNSKTNNADEVYKAIKGAARSLGYICASTLFQKLLPYCQGVTSDLSVYKKNNEILSENLRRIGYEVTPSNGAFYLFVKALEKDSNKFMEEAKKFELLLVPSKSFGKEGYVRISYCVSTKQILDSIPAFEKLYEYYKKCR